MTVVEFFKNVRKVGETSNYNSLKEIDKNHNFKYSPEDEIYFLFPIKKILSFDFCDSLQNSNRASLESCRDTSTERSYR